MFRDVEHPLERFKTVTFTVVSSVVGLGADEGNSVALSSQVADIWRTSTPLAGVNPPSPFIFQVYDCPASAVTFSTVVPSAHPNGLANPEGMQTGSRVTVGGGITVTFTVRGSLVAPQLLVAVTLSVPLVEVPLKSRLTLLLLPVMVTPPPEYDQV